MDRPAELPALPDAAVVLAARARGWREAVEIAGGVESPTISPLRDPAWVAVRVMVARKRVNQVMDDLYAIGARAILVTAIHNARL